MKKKICFLIVSLLCLFTCAQVNAAVVKDNLAETVAEEIETFGGYSDYSSFVKTLKKFDTKNYEAGKAKVNVYIFRGSTCTHCLDAVAYFSSIYEDYKDKMDVVTFEVYNNSDNSALMLEVAEALGVEDVSKMGVPFIAIGDEKFEGYGSSLDASIIAAINKAYENENYVDVVQGIIDGSYKVEPKKEEKKSNVAAYVILGIVVVVIVGIIVSRSNTTYYDEEVATEKKEEVKAVKEEVKEEVVKETAKKTTAKKTTAKKTGTTTKKAPTKKTTAKKTTTKKTTKKN